MFVFPLRVATCSIYFCISIDSYIPICIYVYMHKYIYIYSYIFLYIRRYFYIIRVLRWRDFPLRVAGVGCIRGLHGACGSGAGVMMTTYDNNKLYLRQ